MYRSTSHVRFLNLEKYLYCENGKHFKGIFQYVDFLDLHAMIDLLSIFVCTVYYKVLPYNAIGYLTQYTLIAGKHTKT